MKGIGLGVCVASGVIGAPGVVLDPSPAQTTNASGLHAFVYTSSSAATATDDQERMMDDEEDEGLLLSESLGSFTMTDYASCAETARKQCATLETWLRGVLRSHGQARERWRVGL